VAQLMANKLEIILCFD